MSQPTRAQIIAAGVTLLRAGVLPSVLPQMMMSELGLSPEAAAALAGQAIKSWRNQTRPLEPGE
jgi:hypothetical protein